MFTRYRQKLASGLQPETFFLIAVLIAGVLICFLTPIGAGFDEDTHAARIWEMSTLTFIPNQELSVRPGFPSIFYERSYRQQFFLEPVQPAYWRSNMDAAVDWDVMLDHQTRSIYFPTLYLPQAFLIGLLGRFLDMPLAVIYPVLRLSYLLCYAILTFLAIRLLPFGKWLLTLLALAPMAINQAAIISPDAITHGASFLFIAAALKLAGPAENTFNKKQIGILLFLAALLFTLKINSAVLVLIFLLITLSRFPSKRTYFITFSGIVILFVLLAAGWSAITASQLSAAGNEASTVGQQASYILSHPLEYSQTLLRDFSEHDLRYYQEWVAVFGYRYWLMPAAIYIIFPILLLLTLLGDQQGASLTMKQRGVLIATAVLGYAATVTLLYLKDNAVGSTHIINVQGRYFIPLLPPLFLALIPRKPILSPRIFKALFVTGTVVLLTLFVGAAYLVYHVNCGMNYYAPGYCYKPMYKNWAPNARFSQELTAGTIMQQDFVANCSNMEEILLWADTSAEKDSIEPGTTSFRLTDAESGQIIHELDISNTSLRKKDWLSVDIPRVEDSLGKTYQITLQSPDAVKGSAALLGISLRQEYEDGELLIDDVPADYDLLFRYGCDLP